jgi:signal transduction histidine kinase
LDPDCGASDLLPGIVGGARWAIFMRMKFLRRISPTAWMTALIPLVITVFVSAHILTMRAAQNIDLHAGRIEIAAARSQLLSNVRGRLHHVGINGAAGDIEGLLARLRALPASAEESELIRRAERAVAEAQAAPERERVQHADEVLQVAVDVENQRVHEESQLIEDADTRLRKRAPVFDAVAAGFSLLLMLLGVRAARHYTRLTEERNWLNERRAEELELFAARVAHDLKNPLGAAALRVMMMQERFPDERLREQTDRLRSSLERMNAIIEGLLDFARAGGITRSDARTDLGALMQDMFVDFSLDAKRAGAELEVDAFPPVEVACPPGQLSSVLGNLLRNAIKYIGEGRERRIAVHVRTPGERVRVEVEDTGPGIPAGREESIFEPFVRLNSGNQPGIGLGLATVKRIVEAYGGSVGVRSRAGHGSRFWFELPAAPRPAADAQLH